MKHNIKVVLLLVFLFLIAQYVGIYINYKYLNQELPLNIQRPEVNTQFSFIYSFFIILFMTIVVILLARFNLSKLWKAWFFITVWLTLIISLNVLY